MKVKEESEKAGIKLNIQKMKIMASQPSGVAIRQCLTDAWGGEDEGAPGTAAMVESVRV